LTHFMSCFASSTKLHNY